jgi:hydroxymethylpyrimidine/phosphomethylpyrimidine kinase
MTPSPPPIALTIAGSDSGGGAGIQADLKTFHSFGVYGTTVITAVTAQNTLGVHSVHELPGHEVKAQLDAVLEDLAPDAIKTGMLASPDIVAVVADTLRGGGHAAYVLDPVMVATSGDRLLTEDAQASLLTRLVPLSALVTPNLAEAEILTGRPVASVAQMADAARALVDAGAGAALLKGGHLEGDAVDLLWDGDEERRWRRPRLDTLHTHGTGCTLSAAVTAGLARGDTLGEAVDRAVRYVARAIASAPGLGKGHGPIDHFASVD